MWAGSFQGALQKGFLGMLSGAKVGIGLKCPGVLCACIILARQLELKWVLSDGIPGVCCSGTTLVGWLEFKWVQKACFEEKDGVVAFRGLGLAEAAGWLYPAFVCAI